MQGAGRLPWKKVPSQNKNTHKRFPKKIACMYVCICIVIYMHAYTQIYIHINSYIHSYKYTHVNRCVFAQHRLYTALRLYCIYCVFRKIDFCYLYMKRNIRIYIYVFFLSWFFRKYIWNTIFSLQYIYIQNFKMEQKSARAFSKGLRKESKKGESHITYM